MTKKQKLPKQDLKLLGSECSYEFDEYDELKSRLIGYYKKAKINGIIALETLIKAEKNKTVTEIFMLCIDGYSREFVSHYVDIKAFWLIDLAKRDGFKDREYVVALAKEFYLIKKLALSTMQAKDVKIRANFNDIVLDTFIFTKMKKNLFPTLSDDVGTKDNFVVDIKYLIDSIEMLSGCYRRDGVEVFIANSLKLSHKNLADIFIQAVTPEGLENFSAKVMLSSNKKEFYRNKELFTLQLAVRYILDGYAPRSVKDVVQLAYPEIEFSRD